MFNEDLTTFFNVAEHADTVNYHHPIDGVKTLETIVDHDVALFGDYGQVAEQRTAFSFKYADVIGIKRGDQIDYGADIYYVDEIVANDGRVITVTARPA